MPFWNVNEDSPGDLSGRSFWDMPGTGGGGGGGGTPTPGSDNWATAGNIILPTIGPTGFSENLGSNAALTTEVGEVSPTGQAYGRTAWWKVTPSINGLLTVDTVGSTMDSLLAVYTGTSLAGLTKLASDDDSGGNGASAIRGLAVTAGTTYYIQVGSYLGGGGTIGVNVYLIMQIVPHDNFANARTVTIPTSGATYSDGYYHSGSATYESGESVAGNGGSIWYNYTPTTSGSCVFDTAGTVTTGGNTDTLLYVYTGSAVNSLTQLAADDDGGPAFTSKITLSVVAHTTYRIRVAGLNIQMGYRLNVTGPAT